MKEEFSTLEICGAFEDLGRERLRDWMTRGYVWPSIQKASGHGTKALFNREDVYTIRLFKKLVDNGFLREAAASYIKELRATGRILEASYTIFLKEGREIYPLTFISPGPSSISINLETGLPDPLNQIPEEHLPDPLKERKRWDLMLWANILSLRAEVDAALAKLG